MLTTVVIHPNCHVTKSDQAAKKHHRHHMFYSEPTVWQTTDDLLATVIPIPQNYHQRPEYSQELGMVTLQLNLSDEQRGT